jgi:membrane protein
VASNQQQFGLLGVAFTLFSWLSACAFVIVVATVVGAVAAEDPGRLGRFIRTPNVGTSSSPGDANRSAG